MSQEKSDDQKETVARSQLPYRAEYCKTSRAKCKKCSQPMEAQSLKLANMVKSRWHDGYDATFYHVACFFQIKRPTSVAEIGHFETLKFEDQTMLEKAIQTNGLSVLGTTAPVNDDKKKEKTSKAGAKDASKNKKSSKKREPETATAPLVNYSDYLIEYAKSNRAKCVACESKIDKDTVRIAKLDFDAETPFDFGPVPRWYHVDCFVKRQKELGFFGQIREVKGYQDLEREDQKMLKSKIKPIEPPEDNQGGKKLKSDPEDSNISEEEEKILKRQSKRFFKLREEVDKIRRKDLVSMLEYMDQKHDFKNPSSLVDAATDVLLFGPLARCPVCKKRGGIVLRGGAYICTLNSEGDNPCTYETRDPKRTAPDIPREVFEKYDFLHGRYEFVAGKRVFPSKFIKAVEKKEAEVNNIIQEGAPLEGLTIGVISWKSLHVDKIKIQNRVATLGGKVQTVLQKSLFVILTNEHELEKDHDPRVEVAKALDVPFATSEFLFNIDTKDDVVTELRKYLIGDYNGDLDERFSRMSREGKVKEEDN